MIYPKLRTKPLRMKDWFRNRKKVRRGEAIYPENARGRKHASGRPYVYQAKTGAHAGMWKAEKKFYSLEQYRGIRLPGDTRPPRKPAYYFCRWYHDKWAAVYAINVMWGLINGTDDCSITNPVFYSAGHPGFDDKTVFLFIHGDEERTSFLVDRDCLDLLIKRAWFWHAKRKAAVPRPHTITGAVDQTQDPWTFSVRFTPIEEILFPEVDFSARTPAVKRRPGVDLRDCRREAWVRRGEE